MAAPLRYTIILIFLSTSFRRIQGGRHKLLLYSTSVSILNFTTIPWRHPRNQLRDARSLDGRIDAGEVLLTAKIPTYNTIIIYYYTTIMLYYCTTLLLDYFTTIRMYTLAPLLDGHIDAGEVLTVQVSTNPLFILLHS